MPWEVRKQGSKYCVYKIDGNERLKCHPTKEMAQRQVKALYANAGPEAQRKES